MNKSQIVEQLTEELDHKPQVIKRSVDLFFDAIREALATGDKVEIRGFGVFLVKDYKGYVGRNPKTGAKVEVTPKKLPVFKTGKDLKERVNKSVSRTKKG